jgi:hypothetical protein
MGMKGRTVCAVPGCGAPISGDNNLCDVHKVPGRVEQVGDSTMVITAWVAEHEEEVAIIVLNDWALGAHFSGREGFLAKLAEQGFNGVRNIVTLEELEAAKQLARGKRVGDWGGPWKTQYPWEIADVLNGSVDAAAVNPCGQFGAWSEPADPQKPGKPASTPVATAHHDNAAASSDSPKERTNELLAAIGSAMFDRVAPLVAGTLKQGGPAELVPIDEAFMWLRLMPQEMGRLLGSSPAEANVAAAVAMVPSGVRALITVRVDARVRVYRSVDSLEVSISQCNEPAFLFQELAMPYDATHALHLVCDPAEDTGYTFVMVEFSAGKFTPSGWVNGEEAARYAVEGAKSATGRPPDFRGTIGKSPK